MRNLGKILLVLITSFLLTSCMKYDVQMSMGTDKSIVLSFTEAFDKEYSEYLNNEITSIKTQYQSLGYSVKDYQDNDYVGMTIYKEYDSIDLISSNDCGIVDLSEIINNKADELKLFKSKKNGNTITYEADFTYNLEVDDTSAFNTTNGVMDTQDIDFSEYADSMILQYSMNLPNNVTVLENNATDKSNNGYSLLWNLELGKINEIKFSFSIKNQDVTEKNESQTVVVENNKTEEQKAEVVEPTITNQEELTQNHDNSNSYIFSIIVVVLIIGGFLFLKNKLKRNTHKFEKDNVFHHDAPPNIKRNGN